MRAAVNTTPRLALIGCGAIAENYYVPALAQHPSISQNLIFVDNNAAQAEKLAGKVHSEHYSADYHAILPQVDGAIIAVPTHLHHRITKDFLTAGVPVLCEKPLAESAEKARDLVQVAAQNQVALAVNYLQRLIPVFSMVKDMLTQKTLGEPLAIRYYIGEEFEWPTVSGFYFSACLSSRGILRDRGAHAIDHICWWLGCKPRLIRSQNDALGGSEALALIDFQAGPCSGQLKLSWLASFPCTYTIVCENGSIEGNVYDYLKFTIHTANQKARTVRLKAGAKTKLDIARKILNNFIDVVGRQAEPAISGKDVLDSMAFIDECYTRAEQLRMPWYEALEVRHG